MHDPVLDPNAVYSLSERPQTGPREFWKPPHSFPADVPVVAELEPGSPLLLRGLRCPGQLVVPVEPCLK